jgi:hypothetical protein
MDQSISGEVFLATETSVYRAEGLPFFGCRYPEVQCLRGILSSPFHHYHPRLTSKSASNDKVIGQHGGLGLGLGSWSVSLLGSPVYGHNVTAEVLPDLR